VSRPSLVEVIQRLEDLFDALGLTRSYGGAIAYNYFGPPRLTQDVDVLVLVPDTKFPPLLERMSSAGFSAANGKPIDLRDVLGDWRSNAHLAVFSYRGVRVEVFGPWHPFHHEVLRRSPERDLAGRRIRIHAPEDLIVFKKIFDRPKDLQDIRAMLLSNQGMLDLERIKRDARGLLSAESYRELEELLAATG
jgi:hypothetical protein